MPVLVDERADAGLDARVARELHGVFHVLKRPQDEDVLGPVGPGAVPDCGPPAGDAALDHCTAPALEPLRPILAVHLDDGVGDGTDDVGVRRHVVLPLERPLRVASMARRLASEPLRSALGPLASTPNRQILRYFCADEVFDSKITRSDSVEQGCTIFSTQSLATNTVNANTRNAITR